MASPYLPLPSDSDEDNVVPMSDNEESGHVSSPDGYPYVPIVPDSDTDEDPDEDPEEDPVENIVENSRESDDTPTRQTAEHIVPTTDPYRGHTDNSLSWERTLGTLRRWRDIGLGRSPFEPGESSEQREPLLDSTPIIVNRMLSHENRMDLLEEVLIQAPEPEAYAMLEDHMVSAEEDIIDIREAVKILAAKLETTNRELGSMERSVDKLIDQSHNYKLMENIFYGTEAHIAKKEQAEEEKKKKRLRDENKSN